MIGKVLRGERPAGLIYYLYGPGRREEHTDPHIVAGWRDPAEVEPPLRPGGRRDFRRLTGLLQQPLAALGDRAPARPVWHCVARAAPGDRLLSDAEWADVAAEIMHRTGLARRGEEDDAVRWVAIRHADDHVHIVATLARQDGRRPRVSNDYYQVRAACLAVEERYGLRRTAPADRTAARRPTRGESEKAQRNGWAEPTRVRLRREVSTAAAGAASEEEFFGRLREAGVLVRERFSTRDPGQVTGYAVALPADAGRDGDPVWYGGGKLAPDLTLPKLRHRWAPADQTAPPVAGGRVTAAERAAIWDHAARACADATTQIRALAAAGDPAGAADAAWATADTLHAAASALRSRVIRQAASAYDRAARAPHGRVPRPTSAGHELRRTARLLSAVAFTTHDHATAQAALVLRLAALADAVAELRQAQRHAAQAAAARATAEHLHTAATGNSAGHGQAAGLAPVATLTRASFPTTPRPAQPRQPTRTRRGPRRAGPSPARPGPAPRRPSGPAP